MFHKVSIRWFRRTQYITTSDRGFEKILAIGSDSATCSGTAVSSI